MQSKDLSGPNILQFNFVILYCAKYWLPIAVPFLFNINGILYYTSSKMPHVLVFTSTKELTPIPFCVSIVLQIGFCPISEKEKIGFVSLPEIEHN